MLYSNNSVGTAHTFSSPTLVSTTTVTGAVGNYGGWYPFVSSGIPYIITKDSYGFILEVTSSTFRQINRKLLRIGVDYSGMRSYSTLISGIYTPITSAEYYFPILLTSGTLLAAALSQDSLGGITGTSLDTCVLQIKLLQQPARPEVLRCASYSEVFGESGYTGGYVGSTAMTLTSSGTRGTWTYIGTTTKNLWWWTVTTNPLSPSNRNNVLSQIIDIAVGNGSTFDIIAKDILFNSGYYSGANLLGDYVNPTQQIGVEKNVPAGSDIYVRTQSNNPYGITFDSYITVIGCGG